MEALDRGPKMGVRHRGSEMGGPRGGSEMAGTFQTLLQKTPLPTLLFKLFHSRTPLKSQTNHRVKKKVA